MGAGPRERAIFERIAEVESELRPAPASFADALQSLERLLARHRSMFPSYRPQPDEEELRAHEALYERADSSAAAVVEPTLAFFDECFARLGVEWCVAGAVAANAYRPSRK